MALLVVTLLLFSLLSLAPAQEGIPGYFSHVGWNAIDVSDSDVQTVAKTAVKRFMPFFKLVEVRSAEKQIVAGTNFKLDVTVELSMFGEKWGCEFSLFETLQGALYLLENKCVQAN